MAPVREEAGWRWSSWMTIPHPIPADNTAAVSALFQTTTSSDVTTTVLAPHDVVGSNAVSDDGYNWRKYGHKQEKGGKNPWSYYKCTFPNCPNKKKVERSALDGQIITIVYRGTHNHAKPQNTSSRGSGSGSTPVQPMDSGGSVGSPRAGRSESDEHEEDCKRL